MPNSFDAPEAAERKRQLDLAYQAALSLLPNTATEAERFALAETFLAAVERFVTPAVESCWVCGATEDLYLSDPKLGPARAICADILRHPSQWPVDAVASARRRRQRETAQ